jgi:hypothetical protein
MNARFVHLGEVTALAMKVWLVGEIGRDKSVLRWLTTRWGPAAVQHQFPSSDSILPTAQALTRLISPTRCTAWSSSHGIGTLDIRDRGIHNITGASRVPWFRGCAQQLGHPVAPVDIAQQHVDTPQCDTAFDGTTQPQTDSSRNTMCHLARTISPTQRGLYPTPIFPGRNSFVAINSVCGLRCQQLPAPRFDDNHLIGQSQRNHHPSDQFGTFPTSPTFFGVCFDLRFSLITPHS